jgi:ribosome-binding protein aMBF1 (putative translation factor)
VSAAAESTQLPSGPALRFTVPPQDSEADASAVLPPRVGHRYVTFDAGRAAASAGARSDRKATGVPEATSPPVKSPRRYLDSELAQAIKEAKLKTGASWRRVARVTGLSHSFLVQLSNGQRVPSRRTVEVLAEVLPLEEWAVEQLLDL